MAISVCEQNQVLNAPFEEKKATDSTSKQELARKDEFKLINLRLALNNGEDATIGLMPMGGGLDLAPGRDLLYRSYHLLNSTNKLPSYLQKPEIIERMKTLYQATNKFIKDYCLPPPPGSSSRPLESSSRRLSNLEPVVKAASDFVRLVDRELAQQGKSWPSRL